MIRFDLGKMVKTLEAKENRRIFLKDIAERSGCDKNALSRLVNHPEIIPSANVIDKLVQFFFNELKNDDHTTHEALMREIVQSFVCVFPDDQTYWKPIPKGVKQNSKISLSDVWEIYTNQRNEI